MLKYSIRMTDGQIEQQTIDWSERYLAPDLSYVSGVTSTANGLSAFKTLSVDSKAGHGSDVVNVSVETVRRDGYILLKDKKYKVLTGETKNYVYDNSISFKYVELNGRYYYQYADGLFHINDWLVRNYGIKESSVTASMTDNSTISLDTIVWIENGKVVIDGTTYFVDKDEKAVKYYENGEALSGKKLCDCVASYVYITTPTYVDKFILAKNEGKKVKYNSIGFCAYTFYTMYKNVYCGVDVNDTGEVICNVPTSLINDDETTGYTECKVYAYTDGATSGIQQVVVSSTAVSNKTVISKLERLNGIVTYAKIINDYFPISVTVVNTNGGEKALVYLSDANNMRGINVGDKITFVDTNYGKEYPVETDDGMQFVLVNGKKYFIQQDICSKAIMNGHEYDIVEKSGTTDVFVVVNGEEIPMKKNGNKLTTYSKIVSGTDVVAEGTYDVVSYSGVVIGDDTYIVKTIQSTGDPADISEYIVYDGGETYSLVVDGFFGGYGLVCSADINGWEFSDDYISKMERNVVEMVVLGQSSLSMYTRNTIFGEEEITPSLAVNRLNTVPYSSDDYYSLTDDLSIYVNQQYITLPLSLQFKSGGDVLQDDIVETEFYEDELSRAVNPIVDMERDVYIPKVLLDDKYSGSTANFGEIEEIQINLHFRTRDLDSWKVNETYKNENKFDETNTNWFVTDYEPYKSSRYILDSVSELVGLMNFDNSDVYYQKSRIGNSFLRFSYYDSINPQTQSLLHTSTVFMDEHALYKKYIDNSRNVNYTYKTVPFTDDEATTNKISVLGEPVTGSTDRADFDENGRLSSRFTIKSKYATDTSSEGFYLYIFKEYAENLYAKPIYLRIDFNHAGIGQTLPFMIPTAVNSNGNPVSALTLNHADDVTTLKEGVSLSNLYQQIYIPIYAVYDFKNKEYAYVFDDRYVTVKDNKAILNLYELKIKDESEGMSTQTVVLNYNTKFSGSIKK